LGWKASQLVFIDESGVRTNMARQYGRAPLDRRLVDYVPHGHWKTTTFVAALRHEGWTAPMVLDGGMNGRAFLTYVRQVLAPTLSRGEWSSSATSAATSKSASETRSRRAGRALFICLSTSS
jgi:hypothetical protein